MIKGEEKKGGDEKKNIIVLNRRSGMRNKSSKVHMFEEERSEHIMDIRLCFLSKEEKALVVEYDERNEKQDASSTE